ncbi:MAG: TlpA family protein disulfide reductase, partial [Armatimonadaceae bacterium]
MMSIGMIATLAMLGTAPSQQTTVKLNYDAKATAAARVGYMPIRVELTSIKPDSIKKEPVYTGTARYGVIKAGDSKKSNVAVVLDEPAGGEFRIYVDSNADGDLTNDGDSAWSKKTDQGGGRTLFGPVDKMVKATYEGRGRKQVDTAISIYRIASPTLDALLMYRSGGRTGEITLGGALYKATLIENDTDGVYSKSLDDKDQPLPGNVKSGRPVWLILEADGKKQQVDIRMPFEVAGKAYVASASNDGSTLTVEPTTRVAKKAPAAPQRPPIIANGKDAPDFVVTTPEGAEVKLADYKGKVVILDFWATWCGPCMRSMPHLEQVWKKVQSKNVVVLAVCVWDDKAAYDKWVPENKSKFTFPLLFDAAAKDNSKSIASSKHG